jgi:hypothetical protein
MNRIKGLAIGLGVATLIVAGLACGAGKTPAASNELDTGDGQIEIAQALQAAEGSEVTVSGHLIADKDGNTRLCSVLAESLPPQCGGDVIHLLGFDASSVPNSKTPPGPSDIQTARWTDSYITVTGIKGRRGVAEVQLSTEAQPTQEEPGETASGVQPAAAAMGMMAPNLRLTFDGVEYTGVEILGAASPTGPIVCCGTPVNMDDMKVVGTGTNHNPDGEASVAVYRPQAGATTDVYTFHAAQTVEASGEPGGTATVPATWTRWTDKSDLEGADSGLGLAERGSDTSDGNTVAPQAPNAADTEPDVVRQDESAALAPDIALTAKQTGLPVESVERAIAFQQAFAKYVGELIVRFPNQISAVWTEPIPNTRGHVQFIGEVPPEVTSEIERRGLLDANNVVLTGGGMISMADHSRRAELATEALVDLGYRNFITFPDPIDKVIHIELHLPEGAPQPSKLDLVGAVQDRVRAERDQSGEARFQGRAATVDTLDLELTVTTGSGPIITPEHSRGGA